MQTQRVSNREGVATPQMLRDAKAGFVQRGESVTQWAARYGHDVRTVYAVLNGQLRCHYGKGHAVAVDLRLKIHHGYKALPDGQQPQPLNILNDQQAA